MADFWVTEAMNGFGMTVQVTEELYSKRSEFQKIDVYQTSKLGRMLLLDGIIQLTEFDEFAYHEMLAHIPLFAHENPKRLLVVGGGDGGVLREAGKHPELEVMDICEIDAEVIETAKKFFPNVSCGYDDPRVAVHIADGSEFIKDRPGYYDVIIVDSTDPGGPGAPLFGEQFYRDMKKALRPGGVIATQAESPYLLPDIVQRLYKVSEQVFRRSAMRRSSCRPIRPGPSAPAWRATATTSRRRRARFRRSWPRSSGITTRRFTRPRSRIRLS